jgi:hypothetical protein
VLISRAVLSVAKPRRFANKVESPWAYVTMDFGFSRCRSRSVPAVFLTASLSSCGLMVGPDYEPPPLADQYREPTGAEVTATTTEPRGWTLGCRAGDEHAEEGHEQKK